MSEPIGDGMDSTGGSDLTASSNMTSSSELGSNSELTDSVHETGEADSAQSHEVSPHEKTVISSQPQLADGNLYFSSRIAEMAKGLIGRQLDDFALDELVGGGGMGAVFRGRDLSLGRSVAIKVVPSSHSDPDSLRRFRVEAQSAAKLDHPNIARVYYVGESENWNYIVFEYIEGINLRDLVASGGPLTVDDSVYFVRQIAEALEHACSRDVVHRDVKPSNVLMTPQGQAKLVDMGLARTTENDKSTDLTASGVTLGTFDYISPEQAHDPRQADVRSDLYSLGCTWYYLLTGRPPFPEGTMIQKLLRHGSESPEDPRLSRNDLSQDVVAILNKLMAKRPADRYQRPADLIYDLQILAELENLPRSRAHSISTIAPTAIPYSRFSQALPWLSAVVVVVCSALALYFFDRRAANFPLSPPTVLSTNPRGNGPKTKENNETAEKPNAASESNQEGSTLPFSMSDEIDLGNDAFPLKNGTASTEVSASPTTPNNKTENRAADTDLRNRRAAIPIIVVRPANQPVVLSESSSSQSSSSIDQPPTWSSTSIDATRYQVREMESLEQAVQLADEDRSVQEIWIAAEQLLCRPLEIQRMGLKIRNADGFQPKIICEVPARELNSTNRLASWLQVGAFDIDLIGLEFVANLGKATGSWSMFRCEPASHIKLTDCSVTIENLARTAEATFFYCSPATPPPLAEVEPSLEDVLGIDPLQLELERCVFRGQANWLTLPTAVKTEIAWQNGLLTVNEHMIVMGGCQASLQSSGDHTDEPESTHHRLR